MRNLFKKERTSGRIIRIFCKKAREKPLFYVYNSRRKCKTKTYSHDNYFHSVIGMMDMNLSLSTYNKELDILNQCRK
ncbi:hypothetical protein F9855_08775 [Glaesserella parasuis]|nr:hypothetical protein [Glaesserella parasuis]MWQ11273.1 hypothetical protein [Glaesserella parasuis]MWQ33846.1 hypothetical protein [Glaesserella parasuis]MWQ53976.1 hypothetical protein [Glaesserella parasuis]